MDLGKTLEVADQAAWHKWLKANYDNEPEIWLIYYKKGSGKERISYNDAVEEALCFGWIDSQIKGIDDTKYAQRFSPRKPGSTYSETNKVRLRELIRKKRVVPEVTAAFKSQDDDSFVIPQDIVKVFKENGAAWHNFQEFSKDYQRIRIGFVVGARNRPDEFKKRLNYLIKMSEDNKQFGFGGVEKYY